MKIALGSPAGCPFYSEMHEGFGVCLALNIEGEVSAPCFAHSTFEYVDDDCPLKNEGGVEVVWEAKA